MSRRKTVVEIKVAFNRGELRTILRMTERAERACSEGLLFDVRPLLERMSEKIGRALNRSRVR